MTATTRVAAVVLAAGLSTRMGQPKMLLPWGKTTVIGRVVSVLNAAGVDPVVVVTGQLRTEIQSVLNSLPSRMVYNPAYASGDMLDSLQVGLDALPDDLSATLVALGDQPQLEEDTVRAVIAAFDGKPQRLVVPSYHNRRGHPWLAGRALWADLRALAAPLTLRDFLNRHQADIRYLEVNTPSVLKDLDTPDDYAHEHPSTGD